MGSAPRRRLAVRLQRWFLTAPIVVTGFAGMPQRAIAQSSMRNDSLGEAFVSRRELRVVFPPESKAAWQWPPNTGLEDAPTFFHRVAERNHELDVAQSHLVAHFFHGPAF